MAVRSRCNAGIQRISALYHSSRDANSPDPQSQMMLSGSKSRGTPTRTQSLEPLRGMAAGQFSTALLDMNAAAALFVLLPELLPFRAETSPNSLNQELIRWTESNS